MCEIQCEITGNGLVPFCVCECKSVRKPRVASKPKRRNIKIVTFQPTINNYCERYSVKDFLMGCVLSDRVPITVRTVTLILLLQQTPSFCVKIIMISEMVTHVLSPAA